MDYQGGNVVTNKKIYLKDSRSALNLLKGVAAIFFVAAGLLIYAAAQHSGEKQIIGSFEIQLAGAGAQ